MLPPEVSVPLARFWFLDLRKTALAAAVINATGAILPLRDAIQKLAAVGSERPALHFWVAPLTLLGCLFAAILPAFYFALFRDSGSWHIQKRLRRYALATALAVGIPAIMELPGWLGSLPSYWTSLRTLNWSSGASTVLIVARAPITASYVSALLGLCSSLTSILVLVAMFHSADDRECVEPTPSRLLRVMTMIAAVVFGLGVVINLARLALIPYIYGQFRDYTEQFGRTPPFGTFVAPMIRDLLMFAGMAGAPYIVYRSIRKSRSLPNPPTPAE